MRRVGIILMVLGLAGFLFATNRSASDGSVEGGIKAAASSSERAKKDAWETGRWLFAGAAVMGLVLTVLPGKKT
jgi:hypothetical protein